jgi:hypothetical protein
MVFGSALSLVVTWIRVRLSVLRQATEGTRRTASRILDPAEIAFEYTAWLLHWVCWLLDWPLRLPLALLDLLGFGSRAFIVVSVRILPGDGGSPAVSLDTARRWLDEADIALRRCGILLVPRSVEFQPDGQEAPSIRCSPSGLLRRSFPWFSARSAGGSHQVTVFVVPTMRGVTGCAYPGTDWAVVSPHADGTVLVHEIAHLCDLWKHSSDPDNVMTIRGGGSHDRITRLQRSLLRTSRFARPILLGRAPSRGPETGV